MEAEETIKELMARKNVSGTTIRNWMAKGMPSHIRIVGLKKHRRYVPSEVDAWLTERSKEL